MASGIRLLPHKGGNMPRPLSKTKSDGTTYTRFPEIEAAIDAAFMQDLETLRDRAAIRERKAKDYLPSECLVHLIREARRRGDDRARDTLLPLLFARCTVHLISKVDSNIPTAPQLREDILGDFAELFAIDGSPQDRHELDFFEARFNLAFRNFRVTRVRPELDRLNTTQAIPDPAFADVPIDEEVVARLSDLYRATNDPEQRVFRKQAHAAIMALPRDERNALILVRFMRLKEESKDPQERTAATLCNVKGRTIRYRLARAIAKLSRLKEDA
jgi:hypothetical protein